MWISELIAIMNQEFSSQGVTLSDRVPPYCILWILSFFLFEIRYALTMWNFEYSISHEKAEKILGIQF